jgi:hypothetical protein
MSEYILCRGDREALRGLGFSFVEADEFLLRGADWLDAAEEEVWSFLYDGQEIGDLLKEAQRQVQNDVRYEATPLYEVLNLLMDQGIQFAMWYDIFADDLDVCTSRDDVLDTCYLQMMAPSGVCEVYLVSYA